MKRRDFIRKSVETGIFAGTFLSAISPLSSKAFESSESNFDLVAVRGGEPAEMFDKALEAMGGMGRFIKSGQKILVKPNIGWDASPERAANTNPQLVKRIIERCYEAGAKEVFVFDHTCDSWAKTYEISGIEKAAKEAGAKVVSGADEKYYREVALEDGVKLKTAKVHELYLDSDFVINVPILKNHRFGGQLTIGMKNLMGVVWDRGFWHKNDIHQCIVDFSKHYKPNLTVVDAYRVMKANGPQGISTNDVVSMKALLMSQDIVSVDTAAAKLFGIEPETITYITRAHEAGVGNMNLDQLNISRLKIS